MDPSRLSRYRLLFLGVLVVGAAVRLWGLGAESFWHDEALTTTSTRVPVTRVVATVRASENCPPAYFILANLWSKALGESEATLRLLSALAGIASISVVFKVAGELFDDRAALVAASVVALSPFHIAYSQEARPYALLFLMLSLCTWAAVRVIRRGSARAQVAYVLTATAALYTHTFAIFAVAAINGYFVALRAMHRPIRVPTRRWIALQAATLVLFAGWLNATIEVARMGLPWMLLPTRFDHAMLAYLGSPLGCALMALLAAIAVCLGWRRRSDGVLLAVLMALVPVIGPIAYGIFVPRYGIAALLGLSLLVGFATAQLGRLACVTLILLAVMNWAVSSQPGHSRYPGYTVKPDVRSVARHIAKHGTPGEVLVNWSDPLSNRTLEYYLAGRPFRLVSDVPTPPPARWWLVTGPETVEPTPPFQITSRHDYDGVSLLEMCLIPVEGEATTEPVAKPGRSE